MLTSITTADDDASAADTLRFVRPSFDFDAEAPTDPDATSTYDLRDVPTPTPRYAGRSGVLTIRRRRRQIRDTRENLLRLREAIADGWDVGPELAHEERHLAALVAADRRS